MQFKYLKHDLRRYFYPDNRLSSIGFLDRVGIIIFTQGIWAIVVYRVRRWCLYECRSKLMRGVLKPITKLLSLFVQILTGIKIWSGADIGPGLYIGHFGNVFIGPTTIGKFCNISQETSIGFAGRGSRFGLPVLGDFIYVGAGAKIIGRIRIGNNVAIGANAVVTKDLPNNAVAVGVPAKIISLESSKDLVQFNIAKHEDIL